MKHLIYIFLFVSSIIPTNSFCQNAILTRETGLAYEKCQITALKIILEIYGDSVTNDMLMQKYPLPGGISVHFDGRLFIKEIKFRDKWGEWTEDIKSKFREAIKKHTFYLSSADYRFLSDKDIKESSEQGGGFICPFDLKFNYELLLGERKTFLNKQNPSNYQYVDYVKELIAKYDQIKIKDLDGVLHE